MPRIRTFAYDKSFDIFFPLTAVINSLFSSNPNATIGKLSHMAFIEILEAENYLREKRLLDDDYLDILKKEYPEFAKLDQEIAELFGPNVGSVPEGYWPLRACYYRFIYDYQIG
jgi:hypothetical protein